MADINFSQRMRTLRPFNKSTCDEASCSEYDISRIFESDRGRILNSAAIRRLQQKTQVFPLERNSSVRSRLTHSMEVQQVGRYIAKEILNQLKNQKRLDALHLERYQGAFESLVEMACLMHDIGNPPFGHFGEAAINDWFDKAFTAKSESNHFLHYFESIKTDNKTLREQVVQDLCHFEGNAQAIRLIRTLQQLNLTYAQTACILKYTRPAYLQEAQIPADKDYLMKKPGYYLSEEKFVKELWQTLSMNEYCRHPLTYIMEAADDISYCIADLEDAVEKSILTIEELCKYIQESWVQRRGEQKSNDLFERIVKGAYASASDESEHNYRTKNDMFFMRLRVETINTAVEYVVECFLDNMQAIFDGEFNQPLLQIHKGKPELEHEVCSLLEVYKSVAFKRVFRHEEVEQLELQGYQILTGLLTIYSPLLSIRYEDFQQLVKEDKHKRYPIETRLFHKLSPKHRQAYYQAMSYVQNSQPESDHELWEFYYRCRLIQDYISGMTDHYAYDEYRKLKAIAL